MVSKLKLISVPTDIETEEDAEDFFEIVARNFRALNSRLDSGDEEFIERVAGRSVSAITVVPAGAVFQWLTDTAPSGWLLCYGQAVSRTTYRALFVLIGTTFGAGDGSTTFNLPDLRGRVPLGKDNMGGTSADRVTATQADNLGQGAGAEKHTLIVGEMPAHGHSAKIDGSTSPSERTVQKIGSSQTEWDASVISSQGGGAAHNNMPPYVTMTYIIKT